MCTRTVHNCVQCTYAVPFSSLVKQEGFPLGCRVEGISSSIYTNDLIN